ncbi:hypothetical protein [Selenomonas ruminantium]|uniref:hypothetical protein n=1 Tax=Selenomonas ruminantium TaxID=971 RepID=UPI00040A9CDB|nr:hypothetical protein [Selenomonas ruminantium]
MAKKYDNIYVVGSIKGDYNRFMQVWEQMQVNPQRDLVVFLGDYIGIESGNGEMMNWVLKHQDDENLEFFPGVNESLMYASESEEDEDTRDLWMHDKGGNEVDYAIDAQEDVGAFYEEWMDFLRTLHQRNNFAVETEEVTYLFLNQNWNSSDYKNPKVITNEVLEASGVRTEPIFPDGRVVSCELLKQKYYISETKQAYRNK